MDHTTILLPSPTQYLDLKFRRDSLLTLSFTVSIKASWRIGTRQINGPGFTGSPKAVHTPDVTYEMSTVMTSQHLKLVLTELDPATGQPFVDPDEIFRFNVVQKPTLPEETPNEEQKFTLTTDQFKRQYIFKEDVYAFSKKDGDNYLVENPCSPATIATFSYLNLCTVKGMITGVETSSKDDPIS